MAYLNGNMNIMRFVTRESEAPRYKGIFPLEIDSVGDNLSDWTIYGNTEGVGERTKNNIDYTDVDATMYNIHCYWENDGVHVEGTYSESTTRAPAPFRRYCYLEAGTYVLSGSTVYATTGFRLQIGTCSDDSGSNYTVIGYDEGSGYTFTLQDASYVGVRIYISAAASGQQIDAVMPIMLRKADTTSDFIPYGYQVPLDIRSISETNEITTAYRADINETAGATIDVDRQAGTVTINGTTNNAIAEVIFYMSVTEGDYWYSGVPKQEDNSITAKLMNTHIRPPYEFNKWDGSEPGSDTGYGEEATVNASPVRYRLSFAPNHTFNNLVIKPKVQKATITTHKDIYTGSTPLTEGQSVSRDSTGIEIEVERGQSVIDTTLENKPKMSVVPDSYEKLKEMVLGGAQ